LLDSRALLRYNTYLNTKELDMQTVILNTDGKRGLWSNVARAVRIVDMQLGYESDEGDFGELRVHFDTETWNIYADGLIYTDRLFLKELRAFLDAHGLPGADVDYSEQGMQGVDYVSLDVEEKFLNSWHAKFRV